MTRQDFLKTFVECCAQEEGFYVTEAQARERKIMWPTIAQKNNNPLNLRAWGSFPVSEGYAQFPGPDVAAWHDVKAASVQCNAGWKAGTSLCERNIFERGLTFYTFFAGERDAKGKTLLGKYPGFAPAADQNVPMAYAKFVAATFQKLSGVAIDVHTKISDVFDKL